MKVRYCQPRLSGHMLPRKISETSRLVRCRRVLAGGRRGSQEQRYECALPTYNALLVKECCRCQCQ